MQRRRNEKEYKSEAYKKDDKKINLNIFIKFSHYWKQLE